MPGSMGHDDVEGALSRRIEGLRAEVERLRAGYRGLVGMLVTGETPDANIIDRIHDILDGANGE